MALELGLLGPLLEPSGNCQKPPVFFQEVHFIQGVSALGNLQPGRGVGWQL